MDRGRRFTVHYSPITEAELRAEVDFEEAERARLREENARMERCTMNHFMQIEELAKAEHSCDDMECDECNPVTEEDVICARCKEHSEMREQTGTDCCGAGSYF